MPYTALTYKPGIHRESTDYSREGHWYAADKVRFRDGFPQIIGGWSREETIGALEGICRAKITWRTNVGTRLEAFGTTIGLYIISDGTVYDITPVRESYDPATDALSLTSGSDVLTITTVAHGASLGDRVELLGYDLSAQGISTAELNRTHYITAVPSTDTVEVTLGETASGTVSGGGGAGTVNYLIAPGAEGTVFSAGFGSGAYGVDEYGTPRSSLVAVSQARVWSLDTWGEILVGTYAGGTPCKWSPTTDGFNTRASFIPNAPDANLLLVTSPDRHLVLFGTVPPAGTDIDPLLVRWCDQEDFTNWTITATTTAGSQLLSDGSEILCVTRSARQNLIWSDTAITSMQYVGPPFTFGFNPLDRAPEVVSRNASVEVDGTVMWMAVGGFYVYDGVARVLPCPIKDVVFEDYNLDQKEKFFGVSNQLFQEVWWFYCSANAEEIDRYVLFNYDNNTWSYGTLSRTAFEDIGLRSLPSSVDADGNLYQHEIGTSADGQPLNAYVESAPFDIADGDQMIFCNAIVPDATMVGTDTMEITLKGSRWPQGAVASYGPYTIEPDTERVHTRMRVRQIVFRYESNGTDLFWRGGKPRLQVKPQGRW